jgi:hypothetical protein
MTALSSAPSRTGRASGTVSCAAVIASFAREIAYTPPDALGELRSETSPPRAPLPP